GSTSFDGSANVSINTTVSSVPWNKVTSTPTTLSGYGITDAQQLNSKLTSISSLSSTGLIALTSSTATAARTLQGSTGRIVITNPDGVAGNPTI
ncbi:hypothetical protein, partial [Proteus terrae]|uniref:hypothetical protein n=1 Tax=Proteus terrae TaxID=1574161 RepID=UPI001CBCF635